MVYEKKSNVMFKFMLNESSSQSINLEKSYELPFLGFKNKIPIVSKNVLDEQLVKIVDWRKTGKPIVVSLNSLSKGKYTIVKKSAAKKLRISLNKPTIVNLSKIQSNDASLKCGGDDRKSIFIDHNYCALHPIFESIIQNEEINADADLTNSFEGVSYSSTKTDKQGVKIMNNISTQQDTKGVNKEVQVNLQPRKVLVERGMNTDDDLFQQYINSKLLEKSAEAPLVTDINTLQLSDFEGFDQKISQFLFQDHNFDEFMQDFTCMESEEGNRHTSSISSQNNNIANIEKWKLQFFLDLRHCNLSNSFGNTPLHVAVIENNLKLVRRQCMALKLRKLSIDLVNSSFLTPLQLAILHQSSTDILQELLACNSNSTITDQEGNTLLHLAVVHSTNIIFRMLLVTCNKIDINAINFEGYTALILCALNQQYIKAEALLSAGTDVNVCDEKSGRTALFHAVEKDDVKMVKMLLAHNAKTKLRNFSGTSPHDAVFELDTINKSIKRLITSKK